MLIVTLIVAVLIFGGVFIGVGIEYLRKDRTPLAPELVAALDARGYELLDDGSRAKDRGDDASFFYESKRAARDTRDHRLWMSLFDKEVERLRPEAAAMVGVNVWAWPAGMDRLSEPKSFDRPLPDDAASRLQGVAYRQFWAEKSLGDRELNEAEVRFVRTTLEGLADKLSRVPIFELYFEVSVDEDVPLSLEVRWQDLVDAPQHLAAAEEVLKLLSDRLVRS